MSSSNPIDTGPERDGWRWPRSRLGLKLAGIILATIVVIEAFLLFPSYHGHRERLVEQLIVQSEIALAPLTRLVRADVPADTLRIVADELALSPNVVGGIACGPDETCPVRFGKPVDERHLVQSGSGTVWSNSGDVLYRHAAVETENGVWRLALRLDASTVNTQAMQFILRDSGLVAFVCVLLSVIIMLAVRRTILNPLSVLRKRIAASANEDSSRPAPAISHRRKDEIGHLLDAFNSMIAERFGQDAARRNAQQEVQSQARFPKENPSPVMRFKTDGTLTYANTAAEAIVPLILCDGEKQTLQKAIDRAVANLEPVHLKRAVNGTVYALSVVPIEGEDYVNLYGSDVTQFEVAKLELAHAKSELEKRVAQRTDEVLVARQRLLDAIDAMRDGFAYFGPDLRLALFNRRYQNIFDGADAVVREGATLEEILRHGAHNAQFRDAVGAEEEFIKERMDCFARGDGTPNIIRMASGRAFRLQEFRTNEGGTVALRVDVTDLLEKTSELEAAKLNAENASQAKSEFLANMSHEIRTPMNGVMGMAALMLDSDLTYQQRTMARTILDSATGLLKIIDNILDFSKIEASEMKLDEYEFSMSDTVDGIIALLQADAREKGLVLGTYIDPAMPVRFFGDEGRVRQLLANIVGNAVKFTSEGSVIVDSSVGTVSGDITTVRISVRDTGPGIPEDAHPRLFDAFRQLDSSKAREFEGVGLGLAISHRLINLMGGRLSVSSTVGQGSTFTIDLPLKAQPGLHREEAASTARLCVLLATGNAWSDDMLSRQIAAWGHETAIFRDPDGRRMPALEKYDLAIVDADVLAGRENARDYARAQAYGTSIAVLATGDFQSEYINPDKLLLRPLRHQDVQETMQQIAAEKEAGGAPLPAQAGESKPGDDRIGEADASATSEKFRLLVVEDNPVNQQVVQMMLTKLGHRVDVASNGSEAVAFVRQAEYDLIFMDVHMPAQDGLSATQAIRSLNGRKTDIPIVALTADVEPGTEQECLNAGMNGYVSKPIRSQALVDVLSDHLCAAG